MRSLPLKTTEKIDLAKPLLTYCTVNYGRESCDIIRGFIENLNSLRSEIANFQGRAGSESMLDCLKGYMGLLSLIETRFPFGEKKHFVQIKFKWTDSLNPNVRVSMYSIQYEKACVCYNIAAVLCNMALNIDRNINENINENIKLTVKYFTMAAGIFDLLRDEVMMGVSGSPAELPADLNPAAINMNVNMLLAQAQSCYYEKAVREKLNRSLLSKLANQIALFYNSAFSFANKIKNDIPAHLPAWFRAQELSYLAAANYQRVMADKVAVEEKSEGYGGLIARLRLASSYCMQVNQILQQYEMRLNISSLKSSIEGELVSLEKDNSNIYLEVIPDVSSLHKLDAVSSVKSTHLNLQDLYDRSEVAVQTFDRLVPANIRNKIDVYSVRCESIIVDVQKEVNECVTEYQSFLSERQLPFSVQQNTQGLPDSLWNQIYKIQLEGGVNSLESSIKKLNEMASEADANVISLNEKLRNEKNEYLKNKSIYGDDVWGGVPPSENQNAHLHSAISSYQTKLQQAKSANVTIMEKLARSAKHAHLLHLTKDALEKYIPTNNTNINTNNNNNNNINNTNSDNNATTSNTINDIKNEILLHIKKTNELIEDLQNENEHFRNVVRKDNINAPLMQARQMGEPYEQVLEKEIAKFDESKNKIKEKIKTIKSSIQNLNQIWSTYHTSQLSTSDTRALFFKELSTSCSLILEGFRDASEGLRFFSLLNQYLLTLQQQVNEWVSSRLEEMERKKSSIDYSKNNAFFSSTSAFPSAPPPPQSSSYAYPPPSSFSTSSSTAYPSSGVFSPPPSDFTSFSSSSSSSSTSSSSSSSYPSSFYMWPSSSTQQQF